jgi:hypothetical protein
LRFSVPKLDRKNARKVAKLVRALTALERDAGAFSPPPRRTAKLRLSA